MKIHSLRIQNFRSFQDETIVFNDYTCLVGPNGSGKSTILTALNIFFRENDGSATDLTSLHQEDFHLQDTTDPVIITVTFTELSEEAQQDFADYYRQGKLIVSCVAKYDQGTQTASVIQYGERTGMGALRPFFEAEGNGKPVTELKEIYLRIQEAHPNLPNPGTKQKMIDALHEYETAHPELCELIPSSDQFYGFSKGGNRLAKYLQWVFVPAVKDASTEQVEGKNTALGKLLARTVRSRTAFEDVIKGLRSRVQGEYQTILDDHQAALDEISASLKQRLIDWTHPDAKLKVSWQQDPDKSVRIDEPLAGIIAGEGAFEGSLSRFGHGFQRSYLLALLQELARNGEGGGPKLILGCEEPELYQHPPQARHLAAILAKLSTQGSQIIVCTHSPYFVSGQGFEDVRMVRKETASSRAKISHLKFDELSTTIARATGDAAPSRLDGVKAKIHQALQPSVNEIFFTPILILVEGLEDIAYITTYLNLTDHWDEFRRFGCHLVSADGKSHMIQPRAIAKHMQIPTFTILDSDGDKPDRNGSRAKHQKDNLALLRLCGITDPDPFPGDNLWADDVVMWKSEMTTVVEEDFPQAQWTTILEATRTQLGHASNLQKNSYFIANVLTTAWDQGLRSASLDRLCTCILNFAAASRRSRVEPGDQTHAPFVPQTEGELAPA